MLAAPRRVPSVALVEVQRLERERGRNARVHVVRQGCELCLPCGLVREVRELLALDEIVPRCDAGGHASRIPAGAAGDALSHSSALARLRPPGCLAERG